MRPIGVAGKTVGFHERALSRFVDGPIEHTQDTGEMALLSDIEV
jgi:hypothetical protein